MKKLFNDLTESLNQALCHVKGDVIAGVRETSVTIDEKTGEFSFTEISAPEKAPGTKKTRQRTPVEPA